MDKKEIIEKALESSISYDEYRKLIDDLLRKGNTTGPDQSEAMVHYTELNVTRMNKWDKHFNFQDDSHKAIEGINKPETWVLITEGWCGDAAHSVPIIAKMANKSPNVDLRLVLRDENLDLMDMYLTNGGRSIPKLVRLENNSLNEIDIWGPRPKEAQDLVMSQKAEGKPKSETSKAVQIWYSRNRGAAIEEELVSSIAKNSSS